MIRIRTNMFTVIANNSVTRILLMVEGRVLQSPHKFENFIVATSTLAQVGGFAQKPFWSSFVKICQVIEVAE